MHKGSQIVTQRSVFPLFLEKAMYAPNMFLTYSGTSLIRKRQPP